MVASKHKNLVVSVIAGNHDRDAYAASHSYSSRSEMQAITYHKDSGEVSRVKVALGLANPDTR